MNTRRSMGRRPAFELVPRDGDSSFAVREFRLPRFASPWHVHPEYELTLILAGHGMRFAGDAVAGFHPGDLVLLGPHLPHYWRSAPASEKAASARSIVIQFCDDGLGRDFFDRPEMRTVRRLLARSRRGVHFHARTREAVAPRMQALTRRQGAERIAEFVGILARLAKARDYRLLSSGGFMQTSAFQGDSRLQHACRYVFEHLADPIRLGDAARAAALSPEAFCRSFKRAAGRRFFDFVNDVRISHACAQLIESDMGIAEIAFAAGFGNVSNFNRRFRERKGMPPGAFRRLQRNL